MEEININISPDEKIININPADNVNINISEDVIKIDKKSENFDLHFDGTVVNIDANYNEAREAVKTAKDWATKTDGKVDGFDYSAKYYAQQIIPIASEITTVAGIASDVSAVGAVASQVSAVADDLTAINDVNSNKTNIDVVAGISSDVSTVSSISSDVSTVAGATSDIASVLDYTTDIATVATNISDVTAVGGDIVKITAVADDLTNIDAVNANKTNIDTLAGISSNVTTVAGISSDVTSVASNGTDISTVASDIANVNTVAGDISNVNAVAGDLTNIDAVNANKTNIDAVAENNTNITAVSNNATNINTVAGNKTNIDSVASISSDITTVSSISSDVSTVSGIASDVSTVATNISDITSVVTDISDVSAVASDLTNINSVAGDLTNIDAVNTNKTNIDAVAGNATNINTVAGISSNVTTVAGISSDISDVASNASNINAVAGDLTNINAVANDLTNIDNASGYANSAKDWATKTNGTVDGSEYSAKHYAEQTASLLSTKQDKIPSGTAGQAVTYTGTAGTVGAASIPTDTSDLTNGAGYITGITSGDVTTALGYTPYDSSNPNGYTSNIGTVTSVNNTSPDSSGNVTISIPAAQVNSDWDAVSGVAQILNKPSLATVATSGAYSDLSGTPTIPTVNNATLTITQGGVSKGTFTANASSDVTIALDSGGGGSVSIDNITITENSSNEIQAVGLINPQDGNDIKIWQGTQEQWIIPTTWYCWSRGGWVSSTIPLTSSWNSIIPGSGLNCIILSSSSSYVYISNYFWRSGTLPYTSYGSSYGFYGNGKFIIFEFDTYYFAYSTDGVNWTTGTLPSIHAWICGAYGNNKYVIVSGRNESNVLYSTDGISWSAATTPCTGNSIAFDGTQFIVTDGNTYYTSSDADTWTSHTFPNSFRGNSITYGNGKFVVINTISSNVCLYSTDGINWTEATLPYTGYWGGLAYGDGKYVATCNSSNISAYSLDGVTWKLLELPSSGGWQKVAYRSTGFITVKNSSQDIASSALEFASYYTLDSEPTQSSTVYSEPEVESTLTVVAKLGNNLTLSDLKSYTYTQADNQTTYDTIGDLHPNWICNINGVGVRIGSTDIATNSPIVSSVDSSSTNDSSVGAKLFYDTCGDIETLINAL